MPSACLAGQDAQHLHGDDTSLGPPSTFVVCWACMRSSAALTTLSTRSKGEALRLLRKLVVARVLREDTHRQDNQYGGVVSHLAVNEPVARTLAPGGPLRITLPFLVKAPDETAAAAAAGSAGVRASSGAAAAGKKKPARRRAGKKAATGAADAAADAEVEVIEDDDDDDADDSGASQVRDDQHLSGVSGVLVMRHLCTAMLAHQCAANGISCHPPCLTVRRSALCLQGCRCQPELGGVLFTM